MHEPRNVDAGTELDEPGVAPPGSATDSDGSVGYRGVTACHAVGISYRQLDYWARTGLVVPSVRDASGSGTQRLYSFRDLVVLKVVKRLLDAGVSLQNIRKAIDALRSRGVEDLAGITLISDGTTVYECRSPEEVVDLLQGGQGCSASRSVGPSRRSRGRCRICRRSPRRVPGRRVSRRCPRVRWVTSWRPGGRGGGLAEAGDDAGGPAEPGGRRGGNPGGLAAVGRLVGRRGVPWSPRAARAAPRRVSFRGGWRRDRAAGRGSVTFGAGDAPMLVAIFVVTVRICGGAPAGVIARSVGRAVLLADHGLSGRPMLVRRSAIRCLWWSGGGKPLREAGRQTASAVDGRSSTVTHGAAAFAWCGDQRPAFRHRTWWTVSGIR